MKTYRFEISNCIRVEIEADSAEEARMQVIENLDDYADEMVDVDGFTDVEMARVWLEKANVVESD